MDCSRAVHRDVRDDAATHQIDDERREPRLHHMTAEHEYDAAFRRSGVGHRVDDRAEIARGQDVGKRCDERRERSIVARRMRELGGAHFVGTARDGDGADARQIRLARGGGCVATYFTRFSVVVVVGEGRYDLR